MPSKLGLQKKRVSDLKLLLKKIIDITGPFNINAVSDQQEVRGAVFKNLLNIFKEYIDNIKTQHVIELFDLCFRHEALLSEKEESKNFCNKLFSLMIDLVFAQESDKEYACEECTTSIVDLFVQLKNAIKIAEENQDNTKKSTSLKDLDKQYRDLLKKDGINEREKKFILNQRALLKRVITKTKEIELSPEDSCIEEDKREGFLSFVVKKLDEIIDQSFFVGKEYACFENKDIDAVKHMIKKYATQDRDLRELVEDISALGDEIWDLLLVAKPQSTDDLDDLRMLSLVLRGFHYSDEDLQNLFSLEKIAHYDELGIDLLLEIIQRNSVDLMRVFLSNAPDVFQNKRNRVWLYLENILKSNNDELVQAFCEHDVVDYQIILDFEKKIEEFLMQKLDQGSGFLEKAKNIVAKNKQRKYSKQSNHEKVGFLRKSWNALSGLFSGLWALFRGKNNESKTIKKEDDVCESCVEMPQTKAKDIKKDSSVNAEEKEKNNDGLRQSTNNFNMRTSLKGQHMNIGSSTNFLKFNQKFSQEEEDCYLHSRSSSFSSSSDVSGSGLDDSTESEDEEINAEPLKKEEIVFVVNELREEEDDTKKEQEEIHKNKKDSLFLPKSEDRHMGKISYNESLYENVYEDRALQNLNISVQPKTNVSFTDAFPHFFANGRGGV